MITYEGALAALRGHDVTLYEKTDRLGGQLGIAAVPPRKDEMNRATRWYERAVEEGYLAAVAA